MRLKWTCGGAMDARLFFANFPGNGQDVDEKIQKCLKINNGPLTQKRRESPCPSEDNRTKRQIIIHFFI